MDHQARAELKTRIKATIEQVKKDIEDLTEQTRPIAPENAIGRVSRMDAINNKSVNEAALRKAKEKLSKLQLSLSKIDTPNFGICTRCERPIAPARLMFMPESTRCVHCADK